jgi:hypothetical protein
MSNPLSWVDRVLRLAVPFEYRNAHMPLDECADLIRELDISRGLASIGKGTSSYVSEREPHEQEVIFSLSVHRSGRNGLYESATLSGILARDPETDTLVASGTAQITNTHWWRVLLLTGFGIVLYLLVPEFFILVLSGVFIALFGVAYLFEAYHDRNQLMDSVRRVVTTEHSHHHKPKKNDDAELGDYLVDLPSEAQLDLQDKPSQKQG